MAANPNIDGPVGTVHDPNRCRGVMHAVHRRPLLSQCLNPSCQCHKGCGVEDCPDCYTAPPAPGTPPVRRRRSRREREGARPSEAGPSGAGPSGGGPSRSSGQGRKPYPRRAGPPPPWRTGPPPPEALDTAESKRYWLGSKKRQAPPTYGPAAPTPPSEAYDQRRDAQKKRHQAYIKELEHEVTLANQEKAAREEELARLGPAPGSQDSPRSQVSSRSRISSRSQASKSSTVSRGSRDSATRPAPASGPTMTRTLSVAELKKHNEENPPAPGIASAAGSGVESVRSSGGGGITRPGFRASVDLTEPTAGSQRLSEYGFSQERRTRRAPPTQRSSIDGSVTSTGGGGLQRAGVRRSFEAADEFYRTPPRSRRGSEAGSAQGSVGGGVSSGSDPESSGRQEGASSRRLREQPSRTSRFQSTSVGADPPARLTTVYSQPILSEASLSRSGSSPLGRTTSLQPIPGASTELGAGTLTGAEAELQRFAGLSLAPGAAPATISEAEVQRSARPSVAPSAASAAASESDRPIRLVPERRRRRRSACKIN